MLLSDPKNILDITGLFDPRYFMYYEEVDHCLTVKKQGYQIHYFPHTSVIHLGGESAKSRGKVTETGKQINELQLESEFLFFRKNKGLHYAIVHLMLASISLFFNGIKQSVKNIAGVPGLSFKRPEVSVADCVENRDGKNPLH